MNILLIQPPRYNPDLSFVIGDQEPLGLETLAGMLPQHPIQLLDMRFDGPDLDSIIRDFQPEIVGITGVTCEYNKVCEVLTRIKDLSPETLTVVGGAHATLTPEDFNREFVDVVVIGEGEVTFTEIVEAHEKKTDLSQISGIALRRDGKSVLTRKREVMMDLNTLPLPNRKITEAYRRHYSRGTWRPMGSLYSTRGCPYRCTFCCTWIMGDKKFRIRGVDSFIRDLASMDEHYVFVADDNTIHDTKYSMELVQAVKDSGLEKEYQVYGRADKIVENPDLIEKWRSIGLKRFLIGIEHITDARLKKVRKGSTKNANDRALQILKALDISVIAYFLIEPDFEKADFENIAQYCSEMDISDPVFACLSAYPGTPLYNEMSPRVVDADYEYLDMLHCPYKTKMDRHDFYEQYVDLYKKIYFSGRSIDASYSDEQVQSILGVFKQEYGITS